MKERTIKLVLALVLSITMCFSGVAIDLDLAETATENVVVPSQDTVEVATVAAESGYLEVIFSEDFQAKNGKSMADAGGAKLMRVSNVEDGFGTVGFMGLHGWLYASGATFSGDNAGNVALRVSNPGMGPYLSVNLYKLKGLDSSAEDGVTVVGNDNRGALELGEGTYKFEYKLYVPTLTPRLGDATNVVGGISTLFGVNDTVYGEAYGTGVTVLDSTAPNTTLKDQWQNVSYTFSVNADNTVSHIEIRHSGVESPGVEYGFYLDDIKLSRVLGKAEVYLDAAKTVKREVGFRPGDTYTLPREAELAPYVPAGSELVGYVINGTVYAPGEEYEFSTEEVAGIEFAPVVLPFGSDLIFYENYEATETGKDLLATNEVSFGWMLDNGTVLDVFGAHGGGVKTIVPEYINGTTNKAAVMHLTSASSYNSWGYRYWKDNWYADILPGETGDYVLSVKVMKPSKMSDGSANSAAPSSIVYRLDGTRLRMLRGELVTDQWVTFNIPMEKISTDEFLFINFEQGDFTGPGELYYDDIMLYKVNKTATVYLDDSRTVVAPGFPVAIKEGKTITLPTASATNAYAPEGTILTGFMVGATTVAAGGTYTFTADDEAANMVIAPIFDNPKQQLVFQQTFETKAGMFVTDGGAGPYHSFILPTKMGAGYSDPYRFALVASFGISDREVVADPSGMSAYALYFDTWLKSNPTGAYVGGDIDMTVLEPQGITSLVEGQTKIGVHGVYNATSVTKSYMNIDKPGTYLVKADFYIPTTTTNAGAPIIWLYGKDCGPQYNVKILATGTGTLTPGQWTEVTATYTVTEDPATVIGGIELLVWKGANDETYPFYIDNIEMYEVKGEANVYLDAEKTVLHETVYFNAGDTLDLPTAADVADYVPSGMSFDGFLINGTLYAAGSTYTFVAGDGDLDIIPSFSEPVVPAHADLIFFDDYSGFTSNISVVYGGSGPVNSFVTLRTLDEDFSAYNGKFNYVAGDGIRDITIKTDYTGTNKAIHLDGWYGLQFTGVRIADVPAKGTEGESAAASANIGFNEAGRYVVSAKALVTDTIKQSSYRSGTNALAESGKIVLRVSKTDALGGEVIVDTSIAVSATNTWLKLTNAFTLEEGESLNYIQIHGDQGANQGYSEFYVDDWKFFKVPSSVTVNFTQDTETVYTTTVAPGADLILPSVSEIGFEPVFTIGGKLYFPGQTYKTDALAASIEIAVAELTAPKTLDVAQVRVTGKQGMRYGAYLTEAKRNAASEYGFVVALASSLNDVNDLTLDVTTPIVTGKAYEAGTDLDLVYSTTGEEFGAYTQGEGYYFTGMLVNIPASGYTTDIVGRPYIVIDGTTYYGKPIVRNIQEVADAAGVTLQ